MSLFHHAKQHVQLMDEDFVKSESDENSSVEQELDQENEEEETGEEEMDEETVLAERAGKLGDIKPHSWNQSGVIDGFQCKFCPNAKLHSEVDAAQHLNSKAHRKAFKSHKKALWTPEMINTRKLKNQRKKEQRKLKLANKKKQDTPVKNNNVKNTMKTPISAKKRKAFSQKDSKQPSNSTKKIQTEEKKHLNETCDKNEKSLSRGDGIEKMKREKRNRRRKKHKVIVS